MRWFNRCIVQILPLFPKSFIWIFSRKYIAGKTLDEGKAKAKALNDEGCLVTLDVLGEDITELSEAEVTKDQCLAVLDAIRKEKLNGNLSIKLSSLGLKIDRDVCAKNVRALVQRAAEMGSFIRIDMEDSSTTDATLDLYRRLRKEYQNVGVVIQAYLKRSRDDVQRLIREGIAQLRICKGIYIEPESIAFQDRQGVRENYLELIRMLFESGSYVGIATHDKTLVHRVLRLAEEMKVPKSVFEFQMLLGVTEHLRTDLISKGYALRVYVPYGEQWYGYCMRRMKENPQVAGYVVKSLFIRG
ncbi:MAG TPA: proline dehydrogenase family protein [bacterium]